MINESAQSQIVQNIEFMLGSFTLGFDKGYKTTVKSVASLTNPPNIVKFTDSGFDINMNNMTVNVPYIIIFEDAKYAMWKNDSAELVMMELA